LWQKASGSTAVYENNYLGIFLAYSEKGLMLYIKLLTWISSAPR
jgi:hypothetical protein